MKNALGQTVRRSPFVREMDEDLEALRDDCIALFINSGLTQRQIHAAGGPTPGTITKWLYKETFFPRYQTIASFSRALGSKLVIVRKEVEPKADMTPDLRGGAVWHGKQRPKMPPRKMRKHKLPGNQA